MTAGIVGARHVQLLDAEEALLLGRHGDALRLAHRRDQQHVGRVDVELEVLARACSRSTLGANGRKLSRNLIFRFMHRLHPAASAGRRGCCARRARAGRTPCGPGTSRRRCSSASRRGRAVEQRRRAAAARSTAPTGARQRSISSSEKAGPEVRAAACRRPRSAARRGVAEHLVMDGQRGAERAAGVAGRRLDPEALERPLAQQPAVADAVERDAAGEAEVLHAGLAVHVPRHAQHDLLGHLLDRRGEVHLALRELATRACAAGRRRARRRRRSSS